MIANLEKINSGNILLDEIPFHRSEEFIEGRVFLSSIENFIDENISVEAYFTHLAAMKDDDDQNLDLKITENLSKLEISCCKHKKIKDLSLGDRRKVALIASLMGDNAIIVVDEPFEGLDAGSRRKVAKLLKEMVKQERVLIVASNSVDDVQKISDW